MCSVGSGLSSNSALAYNASTSTITAKIPKEADGSTGFEICRNFFFNHMVVLRVMKTRNENDASIEIPVADLSYFDSYVDDIEAYWTKYEANQEKDNSETLVLLQRIVEFAAKKLFIKKNNFLLTQLPVDNNNYAKPLLKYLSSIRESTFNYKFEDQDGGGRRLQSQLSSANAGGIASNFFNTRLSGPISVADSGLGDNDYGMQSGSRMLITKGIVLNENTTIEPFEFSPISVLKEYSFELTLVAVSGTKDTVGSGYIDFITLGSDAGFKIKLGVIASVKWFCLVGLALSL